MSCRLSVFGFQLLNGDDEMENSKQQKYGFENLIVWQKAMDFCVQVYQETKIFPKEELFGLTSQLRRASYSIPLNISEGSAAKSKKEFKYFLTIALRSQYESITLLKLCLRLELLNEDLYKKFFNNCNEIGKLLNALIKSLKLSDNRNQKTEN